MNPSGSVGKLLRDEIHCCQPHILAKESFSPHIIPKTKGLEESLVDCRPSLQN